MTRSLPPLDRSTLHCATVFAAWDSSREDASALNRASAGLSTGLTAELITGLSELDAYRVKRNGVRVGLQRADDDLTLGVQAGYADGKVKFGAERTRTDASFGVYGRYHLGDAFVSGFAGYGHGKTEVKEASNIRTDSLFGGFMLGADVTVNDITFTPHVGMTAYRITADDASDAERIEFPIGFSVKGTLSTASGWTVKPNADVSFVIGNGDRTVRTEESGFAAESVFTGRHRTEAAIGLSAEKNSFSVDVSYRGAVGDAGFSDHSPGTLVYRAGRNGEEIFVVHEQKSQDHSITLIEKHRYSPQSVARGARRSGSKSEFGTLILKNVNDYAFTCISCRSVR